MTRNRFLVTLALACVVLAATPAAMATKVRPVNLEEMAERGAVIFQGRCIRTEVRYEPQVRSNVTTATFLVDRAVKGDVGQTFTLRALGGETGGPRLGRGIAGVPRFEVGEEVVLFLYAESGLGLSSPVGLGQGKFLISTDKQGKKVAVNSFGNRTLFQGLSSESRNRMARPLMPHPERGIDPGTLLDMAEELGR